MCASYTCITCRVGFKDVDVQRLHYKSDWHRYNLKRKVAELPPVNAEEFEKRVLQQRENDISRNRNVYCKTCRKNFNSHKSFENHLNSKKHKENEIISDTFISTRNESVAIKSEKHEQEEMLIETDSEVEEIDSDEWYEDTENPIDNNNCLFCTHHSQTITKNITHMSVQHSFFVPDIEYCTDIRGLLLYLGEKITQGFMCIWCNDRGRTFHSCDAAKSHMIDKGHCKMLHEGMALAEYADFYDYSSSYPDEECTEETDEEVSVPVLDDSDYQLVLPSGITVGHRSLMRYYKQSIDPNRQIVPTNKKLHKVLAQYRALGWTATQQEQAARKARDIHYMRRLQTKWHAKLGTKANKLQKHFRIQCNF